MKASSINKKPTEHVCYKNWDTTSTAMKSDIIVEGFRQSMVMHNLIYYKLIGDGDSSVLKKIECANHILRNYINRIVEMTIRRKSLRGDVVPGVLRNVLKDKRLKLRYNVVYNL